MIYVNPYTKTFNLIGKSSFYAFQADSEGCLVHLGWGVRPSGSDESTLISGKAGYRTSNGPASFEQQTRRDEFITFGDVSYHEVSFKGSFPTLPKKMNAGDAPHLPIRDVRLRYTNHEIVTNAQPGLSPTHDTPTVVNSPRQTLRVTLQDPEQPFRVTLCYRLTPEHDILERWVELVNLGGDTITVENCAFATLHLPNGTRELTSVSGAWGREFTPTRECLPIGLRIFEGRSVQTSHVSNPFFLLNAPNQAWEETGVVYFGALAYSGAWRIAIEQLQTLDVRVHAGYNPFDFELKLAPNETHATPAIVCGVSGEGWGGASRRLHRFSRERVLPSPQRDLPQRPVLYNSWEATYFALSTESQIDLARRAASIGVELFCVDDGWFGARRNDFAGLGDWVVSKDVFPDGLFPLIEEVKRLGMKFGIWVEPEMVNPDSDMYRAHPDWVLHFPSRPRTQQRNQLILDFGRREVVENIFDQLRRLLDQFPIDFFKWDMNRNVSEPGSVAGKAIWLKHVEGVYSLMDRLRKAYPNLDIQSCSGGGGRIDLGILARTDQVWTSDNTDALDRIRIQEGYSLAYPARAMECWVTHTHNHQTGRELPLGIRFEVAMRGALGIGASLNELSDAEMKDYATYIAFYKRVRHVVQDGDLYRLQRLEEYGASVVQYVLPNGEEAVYSVAVRDHLISEHRPNALLKALNAGATYSVFNRHNTEVHRATGYELMTQGIPGDTDKGAAMGRTLYVKKIG